MHAFKSCFCIARLRAQKFSRIPKIGMTIYTQLHEKMYKPDLVYEKIHALNSTVLLSSVHTDVNELSLNMNILVSIESVLPVS